MAGDIDADKAIECARKFPGLKGMDLAKEVCTRESYAWTEGSLDLDRGAFASGDGRFHVVAYDFGVKLNILRMLADRGCRLTVVPAQTSADDVLALKPDGVFLSNGPGDPAPCDYAIAAIREALPAFDRQLKGFAMHDAVLTGVETRTSSPLRITRGSGCESLNTRGLYPAGEGAGYAGGIMSAAVDGIEVAEALALAFVGKPAVAG